MHPYRTSAKVTLGKRWGATRYVRLVIRLARILRIKKYHNPNNWFRVDEKGYFLFHSSRGRLVHNYCYYSNCFCPRCNKARGEYKSHITFTTYVEPTTFQGVGRFLHHCYGIISQIRRIQKM